MVGKYFFLGYPLKKERVLSQECAEASEETVALTLLISWGTCELVSLSLEMEL